MRLIIAPTPDCSRPGPSDSDFCASRRRERVELLDSDAFGVRLNDVWRARYGRDLVLSDYNLSPETVYALYADYRGRILARLKDSSGDEAERVQRFNSYRDRLDEIEKASGKFRDAASLLEWLSGLTLPVEIPPNLSSLSTPLHMIEPSSIPHTMQLVLWMSPFGPSGFHTSSLQRGSPPQWKQDFDTTIAFLEGCADSVDWVVNEMRRRTLGQLDNADRRSFRAAFAAIVSSANPAKPRKADALGAALFSVIWGEEMSESTYRTMRLRHEKRANRRT